MISRIDPTKPEDGGPASKRDLRANLQAAKDEIEALQTIAGVRSVFGAQGDVDIRNLPDEGTPSSDARLPVQREDGSLGSIRLASLTAMASEWSGIDVANVKHPAFGAVGDGITDDRAAIQAALDAGEGRVVLFPPGRYRISDHVTFPSGGGHVGIRGANRDLSTLVADPGVDVFRARPHQGRTVSNRIAGHFHFADLGIAFNNDDFGAASQSFADRFHRAGVLGEPIGPGGIVFEDRTIEGGFASPSQPEGVQWGQHSTFERLRFGPTDSNNGGIDDFIAMYFSGHTYGSMFENILILNKMGYGIVETMPAVTAIEGIDPEEGRFYLRGGNFYQDGAEVILTGVPTRCAPPEGMALRTERYVVTDGDSSSVRLAFDVEGRAPALTSPGSGALYLMASGRTAGVFSPDQNVYHLITCFCSRGGISVVQQAKSKFDTIAVYGPELYAFQHWAMPTSGTSRSYPKECLYLNGYFEGPTNPAYDGVDYVRLDGADGYGILFPTEIAARNNPGNPPVIRITGERQSFMKISLKNPGAAAQGVDPVLILEGQNHEITGRCTEGTQVVDNSDGSDLSRLWIV